MTHLTIDQRRLFWICFAVAAVDGFDTLVVSFIAADFAREWNLDGVDDGLVAAVGASVTPLTWTTCCMPFCPSMERALGPLWAGNRQARAQRHTARNRSNTSTSQHLLDELLSFFWGGERLSPGYRSPSPASSPPPTHT